MNRQDAENPKVITASDNRKPIIRLMSALEFDADDLDANNHRYMTKKQRKTLSHIRRVWKLWIVLAIIITPIAIILAILNGYYINGTSNSTCGICLLFIAIASVFSLHATIKVERFNRDLLKGDVLNVGGTVRHYFAGRGEEAIHIADQVFRTNEPHRFYGFILGEKYRIFYVPASKYILSAQPLQLVEPTHEIQPILNANPPIL